VPVGNRDKAVDARSGKQDNAPAVTSIATIGTSARHILFPSEAHAAVAAAPPSDFNLNLIDKQGIPKSKISAIGE